MSFYSSGFFASVAAGAVVGAAAGSAAARWSRSSGLLSESIVDFLDVLRTTLCDKLSAHENCPLPEALKNASVSSEGEAFLNRFAIVLQVRVRNVCACRVPRS